MAHQPTPTRVCSVVRQPATWRQFPASPTRPPRPDSPYRPQSWSPRGHRFPALQAPVLPQPHRDYWPDGRRPGCANPSVSTSRCRLRPEHFFAPSTTTPFFCCLRCLTIEDRAARFPVASRAHAPIPPQRHIDLVPDSRLAPLAEIVIDGLPRGKVLRQRPPGAALPQHVQHGVLTRSRRS